MRAPTDTIFCLDYRSRGSTLFTRGTAIFPRACASRNRSFPWILDISNSSSIEGYVRPCSVRNCSDPERPAKCQRAHTYIHRGHRVTTYRVPSLLPVITRKQLDCEKATVPRHLHTSSLRNRKTRVRPREKKNKSTTCGVLCWNS